MPFLEVNGTQIHTQELGAGPRLYMAHGLLVGNMGTWYFGAAPSLALKYRVTLYDLRGHGLSARASVGYCLDTMVTDLEHLVLRDNSEPITIVGHSYGALVALHLAMRRPELVKNLVIVDAPLPPSKSAQIEAMEGQSSDDLMSKLPPHLRDLMKQPKRQSKKFLERLQYLILETDLLNNLKREPDISNEALSQVEVPVLLVYGKHSPLVGVADRLKKCLPRARLEYFDCGHDLPLEKPNELAKLVGEFIA